MPAITLTTEQCRQVRALLGDYAVMLTAMECDSLKTAPGLARMALVWRQRCVSLQAYFRGHDHEKSS